MELEKAQEITERLRAEMVYRRPVVDEQISYYKGEVSNLRYASKEFKEYCSGTYADFSDNWVAAVADATVERMNYTGFRLAGEVKGADAELERIWNANNGDRHSKEAFTNFVVTGRTYVMVTPSLDPATPTITWLKPTMANLDRDPVSGVTRSGIVAWEDDKVDYATLYTAATAFAPALIYKFQRTSGTDRYLKYSQSGQSFDLAMVSGDWTPREVEGESWPAVNEMGEVPIVELKNRTMLDESPISDIKGVIPMQNAINLIWAYLLNGLDFASLPQRVITGAEMPSVPILDEDGNEVGSTPVELDKLTRERILFIVGEAAKIAEWSPANLESFGSVIDRAVEHVAAQTRTPPHYLVAKMVNTSGDALTIAEAGLVSKVNERNLFAGDTLRQMNRLIAICKGDSEQRIKAIEGGKALFKDPKYRSESQMADALLKKKQIGYPLEYLLELAGEDPSDISRIMGMVQKQAQMNPLSVIQNAMHEPSPFTVPNETKPSEPAPKDKQPVRR